MTLPHDPYNLILCGLGGQGNILISRLIGRTMAEKGYYSIIGETFGAAQRGGSVYSSLRISKREWIGPLMPEGSAHLVLGLEPMETLRIICFYGNEQLLAISNIQAVHPVGVLAGRSSYPEFSNLKSAIAELTKKCWFVDAASIAMELGSSIVSNIVLLGSLVGTGLLPFNKKEVKDNMRSIFPPDKLEINFTALERGYDAIVA